MNCAEAAPLLHAHADGELDAAHSAAIEEHLRTCESCAREHEKIVALRSAIGAAALRFAAPAALRERIRETLAQESPRAGSNVITPPTFVWRRWTWPA
ncbi:MAG TPA: zf-HC2 domain-containing protein, partial [Chthoniobacteraceae bacterium]|nr:zf-HC2 domain-containing protein [Chthoniobacteraceae bacterium]